MSNFIDKAKKEILHEKNSYARENKYIDDYIEYIKGRIKEAIRRNQSEYWYISSSEWVLDSYMDRSISSMDREPKDFWVELEKYKNNDSSSRSPWSWSRHGVRDFDYVNNTLTARLKELGCKDVFLFFGPVKVKETVVKETKRGFWGTKVISEEREATEFKEAVRITW